VCKGVEKGQVGVIRITVNCGLAVFWSSLSVIS
jgi:hypothetical protein